MTTLFPSRTAGIARHCTSVGCVNPSSATADKSSSLRERSPNEDGEEAEDEDEEDIMSNEAELSAESSLFFKIFALAFFFDSVSLHGDCFVRCLDRSLSRRSEDPSPLPPPPPPSPSSSSASSSSSANVPWREERAVAERRRAR
jgi:hypothetical protein